MYIYIYIVVYSQWGLNDRQSEVAKGIVQIDVTIT